METKKLKPFDLEKAKAGAKVVTRDGRNVRIICLDRANKFFPIVALVKEKDQAEELVTTYTLDGTAFTGYEHALDLFMAPTIVERWVNVYKSENGFYTYFFYDSEQDALSRKDNDYIATTKISWEE